MDTRNFLSKNMKSVYKFVLFRVPQCHEGIMKLNYDILNANHGRDQICLRREHILDFFISETNNMQAHLDSLDFIDIHGRYNYFKLQISTQVYLK